MHAGVCVQQSNETCDALDSLINNRNRGRVTTCRRNDLCTGINCTLSGEISTANLTIFPCLSPIHITLDGEEVQRPASGSVFTSSFSVTTSKTSTHSLSDSETLNIALRQTRNGINFAVSLMHAAI